MKQWILAINPGTGDVVMTYRTTGSHICFDMSPEEFSEFAGIINGALGDSKLAAS